MLVFILILLLFLLYLYSKRNHDYWKRKGVKYEEPMLFFGGSLKQLTEKVSFSDRFLNLYKQHPNEKFVGYFEGNQQGLLLRDPELIKQVLITDFRSFHHRGANFHKDVTEPLMKNLFQIDGDIWKFIRQKLTPMFSSGKLKAMFPLITERVEKLLKIADTVAKTGDEVDVRDLMARYTTDFIGACGFGIDADTLNNEMSDFRKLGKRAGTFNTRDIIVFTLKTVAPNLCKYIHFVPPEVENQTISLVKEIMTQRDFKPIGRNDFIDLLLELRMKEKIIGESLEKRDTSGNLATVEIRIDDELLAAQVYVFLTAGFETSSSASSFFLHMLAYHPEEQVRCQQEIDKVLRRHDGKLTFDAVREMKYLEMAFKESQRIFTSPGFIMRKSVFEYTFPGTSLTIDEGTPIMISIQGLHSDEKYFEETDKFRPQRFQQDNVENLQNCVFMPFGDGPRACIGARLGMMQSMAGVAAILSKFSVTPSKNSVRTPRVDPKSTIVQLIVGGLPLSLENRT